MTSKAEPLTAFNLTVAEFHTYFVAANKNAAPVWVHYDCWYDLPTGADLQDISDQAETEMLLQLQDYTDEAGIAVATVTAVLAVRFGVKLIAQRRTQIGLSVPTWTVDTTFRSADEAAGVLVNGSYIRNPTARNLSDSVTASGKVRVDGQLANGKYMYIVDTSGNIVIGTRGGRDQRMPHPTLVGGPNPRVQAAGIVDIRGGKIFSLDNASCHFKPGNGSLQSAENSFGNLPGNSFHSDFRGYLLFDG